MPAPVASRPTRFPFSLSLLVGLFRLNGLIGGYRPWGYPLFHPSQRVPYSIFTAHTFSGGFLSPHTTLCMLSKYLPTKKRGKTQWTNLAPEERRRRWKKQLLGSLSHKHTADIMPFKYILLFQLDTIIFTLQYARIGHNHWRILSKSTHPKWNEAGHDSESRYNQLRYISSTHCLNQTGFWNKTYIKISTVIGIGMTTSRAPIRTRYIRICVFNDIINPHKNRKGQDPEGESCPEERKIMKKVRLQLIK